MFDSYEEAKKELLMLGQILKIRSWIQMFQIIDKQGTILGTYHNIESAQYALAYDYKNIFGLIIVRNPNVI